MDEAPLALGVAVIARLIARAAGWNEDETDQ
jgi:hypothetical protein